MNFVTPEIRTVAHLSAEWSRLVELGWETVIVEDGKAKMMREPDIARQIIRFDVRDSITMRMN